MIFRVEAWCLGCQKSLVRVWADKPLDLQGVMCMEAEGHKIKIETECYESVDAMNGLHHHS